MISGKQCIFLIRHLKEEMYGKLTNSHCQCYEKKDVAKEIKMHFSFKPLIGGCFQWAV